MDPVQNVKILDVRKVPSTEAGRVGQLDFMVTYQIDDRHTYVLTVPPNEFNEENIKKKIIEELGEMKKWLGKVIQI